MSSRAAGKGGHGTVTGVHDAVEVVQKSKSPEKTRTKFAKYGHGKSIAKHGKKAAQTEEDVNDPRPRARSQSQPRTSQKKGAAPKDRKGQSPAPSNLRRSPRKKLIEDEPPLEHTLDPFPAPRPPMLVSDKPAVINRYGEKVPAPVDPDQRMRQAINFLSDEGPETCPDFEEKLNRFEAHVNKVHPNWEGITPGGKNNDEEMLARRVLWMIWVHRSRLEEGAEEWFVAHQFPTSDYKKPIPGSERWQALNKGIFLGAPKFPRLQALLLRDQDASKKARELKKAEAVKEAQAPVNQDSVRVAPWDEPMPRPEVWHRKQAAAFPFGETPNIEMALSKQISDDLAKGNKGHVPGWSIPFLKFSTATADEWPIKRTTPWELPKVTNAAVEETFGRLTIPLPEEPKKMKRKATTAGNATGAKRPRTARA